MSHFLPCMKIVNSGENVDMNMKEVSQHDRLPNDIISDNDPQFISKFWKHLLEMLKIS